MQERCLLPGKMILAQHLNNISERRAKSISINYDYTWCLTPLYQGARWIGLRKTDISWYSYWNTVTEIQRENFLVTENQQRHTHKHPKKKQKATKQNKISGFPLQQHSILNTRKYIIHVYKVLKEKRVWTNIFIFSQIVVQL